VKAHKGSWVIGQLILNLNTEWSDSRSDRFISWKNLRLSVKLGLGWPQCCYGRFRGKKAILHLSSVE
jgi:hypothetical protein